MPTIALCCAKSETVVAGSLGGWGEDIVEGSQGSGTALRERGTVLFTNRFGSISIF